MDVGQQEEAQRCLRLCREGVLLRRVKNGRIGRPSRVFIEDDKYFCYHSEGLWKILPTKIKSVEINEMFEVRTGFSTDNLHNAAKKFSFREAASEDMCFSVIFTKTQFLHKSVDFVADSAQTRNDFFNALQYLINAKKKERLFFDEKRWVAEKFREADTNKNGRLSFNEVWKLLNKLNLGLSEHYAKALFMNAETTKTPRDTSGDHLLDESGFVNFFAQLTERRDLEQILRMFSSNHEETFTPIDLKKFLRSEQQFPDIDDKKAHEILETFETGKQEGQQHKLMGPLGFCQLLQSQYGSIIKPGHETVFQDMNHSLTHYFVNSSHNTYLTGLQLKGEATVEGYINALKKGARLLELDVFDGDHGLPCITHKHTLIAAITLRDALTAVDQYAFETTPYPVILTIENHVGLPQQKVMARIFHEVLGDKLYIRPENAATSPLPSPNALKNKYLLRGKKLPTDSSRDCHFDNESDEREQNSDSSKKEIALDPDFSRLISLPSVKLSSNIYEDIQKHPMDGSASLSESKVESIFESSSSLPAYTATRFVKSYPSGLRQDSSNMDPIPSWLCGVQSVAMNMQTSGEYLDINAALFRINGNCGYVLKPDILLKGLDPRSPEAVSRRPIRLSIGIISGQYLPKPRPSKDIIDPYISMEIYGIPADVQKQRSKIISDNGFNPQWNETFHFDLRCPQVAILRICVKDFDKTSANDFIGEFSIPVTSIRQGYSHVRLNTGYSHTVDPSASLLVRTAID
ncbi:1-phosphatidylinositol 4,5-bisphosphate phosphodiesterase delta-4 [Toxocara canis]|uniref:Phosphoinositide phospholipase C n=1 Tax=Toxocara canis TaxID=6265 RepID=A0A0B2VVC4_TOXCA|nr:1-phosphatidylinositol 4,5-bisphosphate phosphodiesterase delta-4 [Toxocara canis]